MAKERLQQPVFVKDLHYQQRRVLRVC